MVATQPPTAASIHQSVVTAAAQLPPPQTQQQEMNSHSADPNAHLSIPPAHTAIVQALPQPPPSIVTSATIQQPPPPSQPVPSTTPTSLLSPNGLIHFPIAAPIQTAAIVVSADHHQIPTTTTTPFSVNLLASATHQFPANQNAALFTAAAAPSNNFVPFLDEPKLKELVRGQM